MRMIGLPCTMLLIAALSGCAGNQSLTTSFGGRSDPIPSDAYPCTFDVDCLVTVTVVPSNVPADHGCKVTSVTPPNLEILSGFQSYRWAHVIRWELDDDSLDNKFRFAEANGIQLKSTSSDPNSQLGAPTWKFKGRQVQVRDLNTDRSTLEYKVNIVKKNDPTVFCSSDPKIFNN